MGHLPLAGQGLGAVKDGVADGDDLDARRVGQRAVEHQRQGLPGRAPHVVGDAGQKAHLHQPVEIARGQRVHNGALEHRVGEHLLRHQGQGVRRQLSVHHVHLHGVDPLHLERVGLPATAGHAGDQQERDEQGGDVPRAGRDSAVSRPARRGGGQPAGSSGSTSPTGIRS